MCPFRVKMESTLVTNHRMVAEKSISLTEVYSTPDGVRVQVPG